MFTTKYNTDIVFIILTVLTGAFGRKLSEFYLCNEDSSVDLTEGNHLPNGDIILDGVTYQSDEFYVDNVTGIERGCVCKKEYCLRKCCPSGHGYDVGKKVCVNISEPFDPRAWEPDAYETARSSTRAKRLFRFVPETINCKVNLIENKRILIGRKNKHIYLGTDGKLYIMSPESVQPWLIKGPENYCIDIFVYEDPKTGTRTSRLDALICFAAKQEETHNVLSSTCMLISCVFILATVAVYAWLPELQNLHGRVLMTYLMCLFVAFILLAIMKILLEVNNININACLIMTLVIYFFLLAAFFWLNVMSFDIWWTFSGKRGMSLEKMSVRARFLAYCIYAFGISTVLTVLLISLEFSNLPQHPLLPLIRENECFIYGTSKLLYLCGPLTILCMANLTFFVLTTMKIIQIKNQTSVLKSKESSTQDQHRNDKQRLLLYVKLFVVMGFSWILEVISALYPKAEVFWRFTDAFNLLIGLFVFVIFVCKKNIFKLIKKRTVITVLATPATKVEGRREFIDRTSRGMKRYKQLRGDPMSRTQTTTSSRTCSSSDEISLGNVKTK